MLRGASMVLLVAAIAPCFGGGVAEGRRSGGCERLRGTDLAPARTVKLVRVDDAGGATILAGCAWPYGRPRTIAVSGTTGTTRRAYDIAQVAGAFLLLRSRNASPDAVAGTLSVWDIRNGDSYEIAYACAQLRGRDCGRGGRSSTAITALINEHGQAAAAMRFAGSGATTISGFSPLGERRDFDSGMPEQIPAAALRITAGTLSWMNAGRVYSEQLPR